MKSKEIDIVSSRNHSIDVLRCVCAFMVVYLHTHYWSGYPIHVCRCAVPSFMMISGYFLYAKNTDKIAFKIQKAIIHIFKIFAWSILLYGLLTLRFSYKENDFSAFSYSNILKMFIFAESDILYFGYHLWYLQAVLYALCILWVVYFMGWDKNKLHFFYVLCPLLLLLNLEIVKMELYNFIGTYHLPTYLSFGIPYLLLGMGVRKHEAFIKNLPKKLLLVLCVSLFIMLQLEDRLLINMGITPNEKYITTTLLSLTLLSLCIKDVCKSENILALIGRKNSLDIYVFHNFILFLYFGVKDHLPTFFNDVIFLYGSPFVIFIMTLLFSMTFRRCLNCIHLFKSNL